MGVSPTHKNGLRIEPFSSRFDKKRRNELQKEAKAELREAKQKLTKNVKSFSWWSNFFRLGLIMVFYFSSSIALTFYQKDLIKVRLKFYLHSQFLGVGAQNIIWQASSNMF